MRGFAVLALALALQTRIPLAGVRGRIDHLTADVSGNRLFVAALGNDTVEVLDVAASRQTGTLRGMRKPQGLLYEPAHGRLYVASGDDGMLRSYDGRTLRQVAEATGLPDADNVRWDAAREHVLVGYGEGAIGIFDAGGRKVGDIGLPAHPESFQVEPGGTRVFINVPDRQRVIVADLVRGTIIAEWPLAVAANFPMALDTAGGRIFVASRNPPRLLTLDAATGRTLSSQPCAADADDLFYDAERHRVYVVGGGGSITVFGPGGGERQVSTSPGARTGLFVPNWRKLFVAAPQREREEAAILVYAVD